MSRSKDILTTGEVAKICKVAPRTVSKWFDTGKLRGYRIPGSKDRRIPVSQLIRFMRAHGMPLHGIKSGVTRVMIVEQSREVAELLAKALSHDAGYEVQVVHSAFEAGAAAHADAPDVMLVDAAMPGLKGRDGLHAIRNVGELGKCRIVAVAGSLRAGEDIGLLQDGYDAVLSRPLEISRVVQVIEDVLVAASPA